MQTDHKPTLNELTQIILDLYYGEPKNWPNLEEMIDLVWFLIRLGYIDKSKITITSADGLEAIL